MGDVERYLTSCKYKELTAPKAVEMKAEIPGNMVLHTIYDTAAVFFLSLPENEPANDLWSPCFVLFLPYNFSTTSSQICLIIFFAKFSSDTYKTQSTACVDTRSKSKYIFRVPRILFGLES